MDLPPFLYSSVAIMDEQLFDGNEFLNGLATVMDKTPAEVLALLEQCRADMPQVMAASFAPQVTAASFVPSEDEDIANERWVRLEMRRLETLLPAFAFEDFDLCAKIQRAVSLRDVISFNLSPKGAIEGSMLRNSMCIITELAQRSYVKIGLTTDPWYRFCNDEYGYRSFLEPRYQVRFERMIILCGTESAHVAGLLEASLIALATVLHPDKCCNVARGGEGKSKRASFFFVYVVAT